MNQKFRKIITPTLFAAGFILLGFLVGRYVLVNIGPSAPVGTGQRGEIVRLGHYKYINPLLLCDIIGPKEEIAEFTTLKKDAQDLISNEKTQGKVSDMAVYVRTLNSARLFGVSEDENFSPASMLKVVTMIAYLKQAEENPSILNRKIRYDGSFDDNSLEHLTGSKQITAGRAFTVEELINYMIVYSDNNASRLLKENLDPKFLQEVYDDLQLFPESFTQGDFLSPKQYSHIFRVLYNTTYLSKTMSEAALEFMTTVELKTGIVAGVPSNITVSHKFGEREFVNTKNTAKAKEFHDCGIVYYPDHPYFICVMTKGDDYARLQEAVKDMSGAVYSGIDDLFKAEEK